MSIPEGATHKMNGSFYIKKEPDFWGIQAGRIPVMAWDGATWHEVFLNEDAPLVEIEAEPYKPVVGGYCEILDGNWHKAFFVGYDEDGYYVFRSCGTLMNIDPREDRVRPIKTKREQFVEKAIEVMNNSIDDSQQGWAEALYDAQFKGPDDE
jgi:hypothetical protein